MMVSTQGGRPPAEGTDTMKVSKKQRETLAQLWTVKTAAGLVVDTGLADRPTIETQIDLKTARRHGFAKLNGNACSALLEKGLIRLLTVTERHPQAGAYASYRVQVAVLTDLGREVAGV